MLILYRKNKQSGMRKEEGADKNKLSGIGNRARVKRFKHDGMIKKKGLWRSVTGVKY